MISLAKLAAKDDAGAASISLRPVVEKYHTSTMRNAVARASIYDLHRRTGGSFGPLGPRAGEPVVTPTGSFLQLTQLGSIHLDDLNGLPTAAAELETELTLSGIHCFGTTNHGSDDIYAVISVISINPTGAQDKLAITTRMEVINNVSSGDTLFKMRSLGKVTPVGSGIIIKISIWDHRAGDPDEVRDKIAAVITDATNQVASAIAGASAANDPAISGGTVGKITEWQVGGIKPFQVLTVKLAGVIAKALADKLIGEHDFFLPAANIVNFADQDTFANSIRKIPGTPDAPFNWPPTLDVEPLISDGDGSYKAYFLLQSRKVPPFPVLPPL